MSKAIFTAFLLTALTACSSGSAKEVSNTGGGSSRVVKQLSLASGVQIDATTRSEISSRTDSAGETIETVVSRDITNQDGVVVIPAGSTLFLTIAALETAQDQGDHDGRILLTADAVQVDGTSYTVVANVAQVKYALVGRGITKAEAARIGAGTAVGAIAGQVIGKNTKSTVIGGAVGAVAGTAVAVRYAKRDVVVAAGTPVTVTLTESLSVAAK